MTASCGSPVDWSYCYSGQYDLWTPESYAHPAKMSPALAFRILEHLAELGLLRPGQTVLDPMCGTGTTLLAASVLGHPAVGVELEERFVSLAQANAERLAQKGFNSPIRVIQGDARNLSTLLQERGLVAVSSPPYGEAINSNTKGGIDWLKCAEGPRPDKLSPTASHGTFTLNYGHTPGQIGSLPDRPVAVSSPPYGEMDRQVTGETPEQKIVRLRAEGKDREANVIAVHGRGQSGDLRSRGYGSTPGQIGNLPDRPVAVTSPPYEDSDNRGKMDKVAAGWGRDNVRRGGPILRDDYGDTSGQLGQERGDTYLSAMRQVYAEIAKVADVLAIVLKNPTRKGQLRRLDLDTIAILEATGWQIHCHHHALLFEEQTQGDMFNGPQKKVKGRMSFFKRLSWAKGAPVAQWEDVIVAVHRG